MVLSVSRNVKRGTTLSYLIQITDTKGDDFVVKLLRAKDGQKVPMHILKNKVIYIFPCAIGLIHYE